MLRGQHLSGYFGAGPKYATVTTRSIYRTITTFQEVLWTDTRFKQLMPPILVSLIGSQGQFRACWEKKTLWKFHSLCW